MTSAFADVGVVQCRAWPFCGPGCLELRKPKGGIIHGEPGKPTGWGACKPVAVMPRTEAKHSGKTAENMGLRHPRLG